MQNKKGTIIAITSTKGGVGKTITTLNLAGIYETLQKKILIIDLDIYGGNIATFVNSSVDKTIFNFIEDYTHNRYESIDDYVFRYDEFISVIAAPKDPRLANKIDGKYITILLDTVIYKYDVILLDTSHNFNDINIITLDSSDKILYILTNDSFDLKNTRTFMNIMKNVSFDNVFTLLNNSISNKDYYSLYDIRNIINSNIDFTLPKSFYIKNIDKYISSSEIPILCNSLGLKRKNGYKNFVSLAKDLIDDKEVKQ